MINAGDALPSDRYSRPILFVGLLSAGLLAFALGLPTFIIVVSLVATVVLVVTGSYVRHGRDVFHPLVFPLAYLTFALLAPWIYVSLSQRPIGRLTPASLDSQAIWVMIVTVFAWLVGAVAGLQAAPLRMKSLESTNPMLQAKFRFASLIGRSLLTIVAVGKVVQARMAWGRTYGAGQIRYDAYASITTVLEGLLLIAVLLIVVGNLGLGHRVLAWQDWLTFMFIATVSVLFLGSRSELIAPLIIVLWGYNSRRRVSMRLLAVLGFSISFLFVWVAATRSQRPESLGAGSWSRLLLDVSSPFTITDRLAGIVPMHSQYEFGATYFAAVRMLLPGPVLRRFMTDPPGTATFVFRDLADYNNPNQGFGFALPAEAYLNFGMIGVMMVPLLVGWLYARSYGWLTSRQYGQASRYLYVILVAALPYGLRSDALGQLKLVLYPMIALALTFMLCKLITPRSRSFKHVADGAPIGRRPPHPAA